MTKLIKHDVMMTHATHDTAGDSLYWEIGLGLKNLPVRVFARQAKIDDLEEVLLNWLLLCRAGSNWNFKQRVDDLLSLKRPSTLRNSMWWKIHSKKGIVLLDFFQATTLIKQIHRLRRISKNTAYNIFCSGAGGCWVMWARKIMQNIVQTLSKLFCVWMEQSIPSLIIVFVLLFHTSWSS